MGEVFTRRLRELDDEAKKSLAKALKTLSDPVLVRSAFELPRSSARRYRMRSTKPSRLKSQIRFETAPDVISGIELTTNGQKVAWSIADYLASLEKGVGELLKEKDKPEAKTEPKPKSGAEPAAPEEAQ
jgi:F-type H+-transporting ATPase subunit b